MKQKKSKVVDNKLKAATACTTQGSVYNFVRVKLHMECRLDDLESENPKYPISKNLQE